MNDNSKLSIDLQQELVFGGTITYSSILPKIKCSDFIRDICIRFGLILNVDEFNKKIKISKIDGVLNIADFDDWSDKLDDEEPATIEFKYDNYAQISNFKHKEDKSTPKKNDKQSVC
jgi:hypothetical protein